MGTLISVVVFSLFFGIVFTKIWQTGRLWNRITGKPRSTYVKPFDCLPCMSFWLSFIPWPYFLQNGTNLHTLIVSTMAAFVVAYVIEKR